MTLGISLRIDVTKLDKDKLFQGKKGKYCDLTVFIDPNKTDEYGNHGGIFEAQSKEERESKANKNFVGNAKVFFTDTTAQSNNEAGAPQGSQADDWDDDIPF